MISHSKVSYKEILKLSLPIIAGSAIENITTITNTIFLGRVGPVALGAVALGGIFYLALIMIAFGFGIGAQILIARRYGEKNLSEIGSILHHAAIFLFPLAIIIIAIYFFQGNLFFKHFLKSEAVYEGVSSFMKYRIWGLTFAYINILFKAFYIGIMQTRIIGLSSFIIAVVNIIFDYSLIFGHFGLPQMGIAGAGLASVIAEIVGTAFFVIYTSSRQNINEFKLTKFAGFNLAKLGHIFKVSAPVMVQFSVSFGGWFLFFMFVEQMGEIPLAASNLVRTVYMIVLLPLWGLASATNTLVSYKFGSSQVNEIGAIVRKILFISIIITGSLACIVNLFSESYFSIFTSNAELIQACKPILIVVSISSILVSISVILYNIISGSGKTHITLFIEFVVIVFYVVWAYFTVNSEKGTITIVWMAEILYGLVMGIMSGIYLRSGKWKKSKI